ncbi:MAG: hypothetical protein ABIA04_09200 [Pseudomonadota bacterium]
MYFCWKCHKEVDMEVRITRFDTCEFCSNDLRVCYNCKYYDEGMPNSCKEPLSAYIPDREKGNTCGLFEYIKGKEHLQKKTSREDIKSQLDSLFKK